MPAWKKRKIMSLIKALVITGVAVITSNAFAAESPGLAKLQGKWSGTRPASDGQTVMTTLEIQGSKLTFQTLNADKEVRFIARGTVKAESVGGINVMKITGIEAGRSASETQAVDDDRSQIYTLRGDTLFLASNFDRERENEKPRVEVFERVAGAKEAATTPGDGSKLAGKWKVTAKLGEDERDYELNLAEAAGKLSGTLVSPRSGEHKFKTVTFSNGKLTMELPREIEGNDVTFVYTGELKGAELGGALTVKGLEEQFTGSWTARK
jgi:hypothetical protein